jgi:hypothetical protein
MDIITSIITPILSLAVYKATTEAWRSASAWWSLDDLMPKVNRAFNQVRNELCDVGLLAADTYLDKIDLQISAIPSYGEAGYVYESVGWLHTALGFEPGVIYLPSDLPREVYVPGGTLTDVIRHEFAHAWHWLDPDLIERPWFRATFGTDYNDTDTTPSELWVRKLKRTSKRIKKSRNHRVKCDANREFTPPGLKKIRQTSTNFLAIAY